MVGDMIQVYPHGQLLGEAQALLNPVLCVRVNMDNHWQVIAHRGMFFIPLISGPLYNPITLLLQWISEHVKVVTDHLYSPSIELGTRILIWSTYITVM